MSLKAKYALITGSSRGIGRGIALKLAEPGVKVAINYCRNEVAANDVLGKVRGLGSDGFIVQGDVCRPEDIAGMFRRARQEFGALDIFVANARPEGPTFYQPPMENRREVSCYRSKLPFPERSDTPKSAHCETQLAKPSGKICFQILRTPGPGRSIRRLPIRRSYRAPR
jgi:NAD(P)-dependent dehydrogenase (short-subunit alcohol dehydrogenase family)